MDYHICGKLDDRCFVELHNFAATIDFFIFEIHNATNEGRKHDADEKARPRGHQPLLPRSIENILTGDARQEDLALRLRCQLQAAHVVPELTLLLEKSACVLGLSVMTLVQNFHRQELKFTKK